MEVNNQIENIEGQVLRYINGQLCQEESKKLEQWIVQSKEHQHLFKQINTLSLATDYERLRPKVNTKKALKNIKKKAHRKTYFKLRNWLLRAAAVLFIPLLSVVMIQYFSTEKKVYNQSITIKTNPGMTTSFVLPDSTKVYLNSESTLKYLSKFTENNRMVELDGEAYFEVTHDPHSKFIVKTPHQTNIVVHGTKFNVEAYSIHKNISATLLEGKISFHYPDKVSNTANVIMSPRHKIVFDSDLKTAQLYRTSCLTETSWIHDEIILNNTGLEDVLRILEKRYHIKFTLQNLHPTDYAFTGTFTNQRLERILDYFRYSSKIQWKYIDDHNISDEKNKVLLYK